MNTLRNIFTSRTINYLRQNGQNALINLTQPVDNASTQTAAFQQNAANKSENRPKEPLLIPKSILDATVFTGKKFPKTTSSTGSISPTTLKNYERVSRKLNIVYRCKICNTRNVKQISEAAYTGGVVILQCDGCAVNHLIIDNLGWFANTKGKTFDEVLAEKKASVKVIKVNENGELI